MTCDLVLARSGKNLCSSSFFDFRIDDAVYQEGSVRLINNVHLITRVYGMPRVKRFNTI